MNIKNSALICVALAVIGGISGIAPRTVFAQTPAFPDVPTNHWAYQAVTDLANEGYVLGYPDGKFLGGRAMTRYEFATVIDRMVQTINALKTQVNTPPVTPTGVPVTQDDLNKIQSLVDEFQTQLTTIQSNIVDLQASLDALRQDVLDTKAYALKANIAAAKAQSTANNSYGSDTSRKFSITGYIQTRYVAANSGNHYVFPQGANAAGAIGIAPAVNGTYAQGGTRSSEEVRRARILVSGHPTDNTSYKLELDMSGAVAGGESGSGTAVSANQQVTVRQANGTYLFGSPTNPGPAITAGLFPTPFGYILPNSNSKNLTPERPLAFNESNHVGLFDSQDYDKGAELSYTKFGVTGTYALISGSGRQAETVDNHGDSVVRVAYASPTKIFNVGASYYDGSIYRARGTITTETYPEPKKQLVGGDAQLAYKSVFVDYEYIRGTYEDRSYFNYTPTSTFLYGNPLGFSTDSYVKGNQVQGSYIWGGYTFDGTTNNPLTLAVDYDVFQRSMSDEKNASNSYASGSSYFPGGSTYDDVNFGYGALYNLDKATRLRLWYDHPLAVAHDPTSLPIPEYGLYTAELQFKF